MEGFFSSIFYGLSPRWMRETIPTGFRKCFLASGLQEAAATEAPEIEHQPVAEPHTSRLFTALLFYYAAAPKHGRNNTDMKGGSIPAVVSEVVSENHHATHARRILSSLPHPLLQLPCLLVPLSCTPSFALKDSVIFRRHVLHASHLHSSTHAGIISPTIIYVCLFLAGRR